jgi:Flp pilus assembly pilin Flp
MNANAIKTVANSARSALGRLHRDEAGQGMTEYVIILVAIAVVCIAIAVSFGGKIKGLFEEADGQIDNVDSGLS